MFTITYHSSRGGETLIVGLTAPQAEQLAGQSDEELIAICRQGTDYIENEVIVLHINGSEPAYGELDGEEMDEAIIEEKNDDKIVEVIDCSEYIDKLRGCASVLVYIETARVSCEVEIDKRKFNAKKLAHVSSTIQGFDTILGFDEYRINEIIYDDERYDLDWVAENTSCEIEILKFTIEDDTIKFGEVIRQVHYSED